MGVMKRLHEQRHRGQASDDLAPWQVGKLTWWIRFSREREDARIADELAAKMLPIGNKPASVPMLLPPWMRTVAAR